MIRLLLSCLCISVCSIYADEVVWKGKIEANGAPSEVIKLNIHDQYQIRVSQFINLGKWKQAGESLANDACYEFSDKFPPTKFEALKNSDDISVCDGKYHADHIYESKPFVAKQNRIFFWVNDTDYDDNSLAFDLEIIRKK